MRQALPRALGRLRIVATCTITQLAMGAMDPTRAVVELDLALVEIEPGTFLADNPANEQGRGTNEDPCTEITLTRPFWLGRCEATQGQWEKIMRREQAAQTRLAPAKLNKLN